MGPAWKGRHSMAILVQVLWWERLNGNDMGDGMAGRHGEVGPWEKVLWE